MNVVPESMGRELLVFLWLDDDYEEDERWVVRRAPIVAWVVEEREDPAEPFATPVCAWWGAFILSSETGRAVHCPDGTVIDSRVPILVTTYDEWVAAQIAKGGKELEA